MATGIVRTYNDSKGFGLITPDLGGAPVFARQASMATPGVRKLESLDRVSYDVLENAEGWVATNFQRVRG
jgi:CspA family cold shock protein